MMNKIITPGSYTFDTPAVSQIKSSSRGLIGDDLGTFIKRAGYKMADEVRRIKFAAGEVPVHLIAIGATETYGSNRNGDAFDADVCRKFHPTFVKHARWYRNHCNKDKAKSYGLIKHSCFNEAMQRIELVAALNSTKEAAERNGGLVADEELEKLARGEDIPVSMACAKSGTLIYTDRGFKPIETIEPGDLVLTHLGHFRSAGNRSIRETDEIVRIDLRYYGRQTLEFTPNHEFYVARWEDIPKGSHVGSFPGNQFRKKYRDRLYEFAHWRPCRDLKRGDILLVPIRYGKNNKTLSMEEARLLGYYTAEGSIIDNSTKGACFTVNRADAFVKEIDTLVQPHVTVCKRAHSGSEHALSVEVYSRELFDICMQGVGRRVENKHIPEDIWNATAELKLHYVSAWLNGDGWQDIKGLHWSTCSRSLSLELQNILASIGIPASVYRIDHTSDLPHSVKRTGTGTEYTVNVSNRYSGMFANKSKAVTWETAAVKTTVFITGPYLAIPIAAISHIRESCTVYNFAVAEDETYTAFGIAVHNCKVPFDICSGCGNKAKTRAEYCKGTDQGGHCKEGGCSTRLGQVNENGHHLHVKNTIPDFFDLSKVWRGADHIAFTLGEIEKAAAAGGVVVGGAELSELIGLTTPFELFLETIPERKVSSQLKLAYELAKVESAIMQKDGGFNKIAGAFMPAVQPTFLLGIIDTPETRAQGLKALALEKIALPLADFLRMYFNGNATKAAEMTPLVAPYLRGIYTYMTDHPEQLATDVRAGKYVPDVRRPTKEAAAWAKAQAVDFSLDPRLVERRAWRATLRDAQPQNLYAELSTKSAYDKGELYNLAKEYALYKLAMLNEIRESDTNFVLTCDLAIRQNHIS